jgi:hypothetical protein
MDVHNHYGLRVNGSLRGLIDSDGDDNDSEYRDEADNNNDDDDESNDRNDRYRFDAEHERWGVHSPPTAGPGSGRQPAMDARVSPDPAVCSCHDPLSCLWKMGTQIRHCGRVVAVYSRSID